jgi:hypothetical protein
LSGLSSIFTFDRSQAQKEQRVRRRAAPLGLPSGSISYLLAGSILAFRAGNDSREVDEPSPHHDRKIINRYENLS